DNTRREVETLRDSHLTYLYQPNRGVAAARNAGARIATGSHIIFLDHDDLLLPVALETCSSFMSNHPETGMAVVGYEVIDRLGRVLYEVRPWELKISLALDAWLLAPQAMPTQWILRRDWWVAVGGIDEGIKDGEDWDFGF